MKVSERVLVASLIVVLASVALAQAGERPCPGNYTCVPVAAGTYHTDEFLLPLTFTVADGWEFWLDSPNHVALGRAGWETRELEFIQTALRIRHNITALNQDCSESAQPGVPMRAASLVDYWRSLPSVASTAPMEVEVGGLTGLMFDVSVEPSWTESCDWSLDRPIALLMYAPRPNPTQHGIVPGERIRFYVLDHSDGNVVIEVAHTPDSPVSWDEWMEMTGSVIESLEFAVP